MSVWYYEPFYDFERLVDNALTTRSGASNAITDSGSDMATRPLKPRMDLKENNDKNFVIATFELPGLKKDDVNIEIHNNRLTVSGEAKDEVNKEEAGYAIHERRFGKFARTLQLPAGVEEDQIKAQMHDGLLEVQFPKVTPEQAHKKITIN